MTPKRIAGNVLASAPALVVGVETPHLRSSSREQTVATNRLGREIGAALVIKVMALALLYFAFFSPSHRPTVTPAAITTKLFAGSEATPR